MSSLIYGEKGIIMSWRDVFDCKIPYTYPDDAARKAFECGYKFFAWNGQVLFVLNEKGNWAHTGIQVCNLFKYEHVPK